MYILYITITLRMGLRHALPDGLRSKYGVSRRMFTRCMTAPCLIRTVPFVETCSTVYGPSRGADIFRTLPGNSSRTLSPTLYVCGIRFRFFLVAHYGLRRGPTFSVIVTEFRYGTVTVSESFKLTNMIQKFSVFFAIISIKSHSITKFLYEGRSIDIKEQHE